MTASRLILFAARWAIMSGLAGIVFAVLVFTDDHAKPSGNRMLLAAAVLLSIAFILAPFVRNAFVGAQRAKSGKQKRKTLLDEMRDSGEASGAAADTIEQGEPPRSALVSRLLIALYVAFGAMLAVVLWSMS